MKMVQSAAAAHTLGYNQGFAGDRRNGQAVPADLMPDFKRGYREGTDARNAQKSA